VALSGAGRFFTGAAAYRPKEKPELPFGRGLHRISQPKIPTAFLPPVKGGIQLKPVKRIKAEDLGKKIAWKKANTIMKKKKCSR